MGLNKKKKGSSFKQVFKELLWIVYFGKQYNWQIFLYIVIGIFNTGMGLCAGVLGKDIIDTVIGVRTGKVVFIGISYVVMQLMSIAFSALTQHISTRVQLDVGQRIRRDVFSNIINAQWEAVSQYRNGDLLARCTRDAGAVSSAVMGWLPSLVVNGIQFFGAFILILYYDYTLALLALVTSPIVLAVSYFLTRRVREHSKKMHVIGSELTSFHTESFQNLQLIKSFYLNQPRVDGLKKLQSRQKDVTLEHNGFSIMTSSFISLAGMTVSALCFLWSVYRLWGGFITFGEMTMFLQMTGTLSSSFGALATMVPATVTMATSAGRIMEIADLPTEEFLNNKEVDSILSNERRDVSISVNNADFSYSSGNIVFRNANIKTAPGQIVALIGSSGEGKTTVLRVLLGLVKIEKGSITISGGDPEITLEVSPSTRRLFSYVPQDNTLFAGTVADNLRLLCADATEDEMWEALRLACAEEFVKEMPNGLYSFLGEDGYGLSEGQRQRLGIARALLSPAPVLLLDEATSALDGETERVVLNNIGRSKSNRTIIVTTHRASVLEMCNKVYKIDDECVVEADIDDIKKITAQI